jgi:hypothetical protein
MELNDVLKKAASGNEKIDNTILIIALVSAGIIGFGLWNLFRSFNSIISVEGPSNSESVPLNQYTPLGDCDQIIFPGQTVTNGGMFVPINKTGQPKSQQPIIKSKPFYTQIHPPKNPVMQWRFEPLDQLEEMFYQSP